MKGLPRHHFIALAAALAVQTRRIHRHNRRNNLIILEQFRKTFRLTYPQNLSLRGFLLLSTSTSLSIDQQPKLYGFAPAFSHTSSILFEPIAEDLERFSPLEIDMSESPNSEAVAKAALWFEEFPDPPTQLFPDPSTGGSPKSSGDEPLKLEVTTLFPDFYELITGKSQPPIAVENRRSKRTFHNAAAVFYGAAERGIGSFIYPDSQVGIKLTKAHPANRQHYLGLQVIFPRSTAPGDGTWYQGNNPGNLRVSHSYVLTSRYPEGTKIVTNKVTDEEFQVIKPLVTHRNGANDFVFIRIELPDGQYPVLEGVGPFIPEIPQHRQVIEDDDVVENKERLSRILFKQRLTLLTRSKNISVLDDFTTADDLDYTPFTYGYGSES